MTALINFAAAVATGLLLIAVLTVLLGAVLHGFDAVGARDQRRPIR